MVETALFKPDSLEKKMHYFHLVLANLITSLDLFILTDNVCQIPIRHLAVEILNGY
jgi:hypothetical protein